jgi:hypothetical protein
MKKILFLLISIIFVISFFWGAVIEISNLANSISPNYGYVVSMHHNNNGYYIQYSDEGSLWYAKVNYPSYITCKPGMYWQGEYSQICTNTK